MVTGITAAHVLVGEPKSQKLNEMGWTWHGLPYFLDTQNPCADNIQWNFKI